MYANLKHKTTQNHVQSPHYARKFENAAFFLPSTLIRHENGTFRKRFSNRRNLKTPALQKPTELFENDHDMWQFFQDKIQNDQWLLRYKK